MSVFRVQKTRNFTIMSNHHLQNSELSFKARGILSTMLSLPDDWDYTLAGLAKIAKDGVSSVKAGIEELEKAGYIRRAQGRAENGQFSKNLYDVYEIPLIVDESEENIAEPVTGNTAAEESEEDTSSFEEPLCENLSTAEISSYDSKEEISLPLSDFPSAVEPSTDEPFAENCGQLNTNKQKIKIQNTDLQNTCMNNINPSINPYDVSDKTDRIDRINSTDRINKNYSTERSAETYEQYKEIIKQNIDYDDLKISKTVSEMQEVDELVAVMTEVVAFAVNPLHINGDYIPADMVRKRFLDIGYNEIDYILYSIHNNTAKVRNIRSYMIATLYNASSTINNYFGAEVRHDFGGAGSCLK